MGDMSKSNNTGMKNIDPATSVGYSHGTNHLGERCLFLDNVDCNESCDGFTVEQIDFLDSRTSDAFDFYNVLDNVDCDESCDGFTIEQIDFLIRMLEKQREVMIDQYNSEGVGELFDNSYELED